MERKRSQGGSVRLERISLRQPSPSRHWDTWKASAASLYVLHYEGRSRRTRARTFRRKRGETSFLPTRRDSLSVPFSHHGRQQKQSVQRSIKEEVERRGSESEQHREGKRERRRGMALKEERGEECKRRLRKVKHDGDTEVR